MHLKNIRRTCDTGDRSNVAKEVEGQALVKRRVHRIGSVDEKECVAVWRRANDYFGAYVSGCPRPVLDDEGLAETLRKHLPNQPSHNVPHTAGWEAGHDPHRFGRIGLGTR